MNKKANETTILTLAELFPSMHLDVLTRTLNDADQNLELACSMLLSGNQVVEEPVDQQYEKEEIKVPDKLSEMFPKLSRNFINNILLQEKNDIEKVIPLLLNYEALSNQDIKEQQEIQKAIKNKPTIEETKDQWSKTTKNINKIMDLTGIPETLARNAYFKSNFSTANAIISIIENYKEYTGNNLNAVSLNNNNNNIPINSSPPMSRIKGGKVQSANGYSYKAINFSDNQILKPLSMTQVPKKDNPFSAYRYSATTSQAIELEEILNGNPVLKTINRNFLRKALEFYNGDVDKTILLCKFLIDEKAAALTFKIHEGHSGLVFTPSNYKRKSEPPFRDIPMQENHACINNINTSMNKLSFSAFRSREDYLKAKKMLETMFDTFKLDFHSFTSEETLSILEIALEMWWNEEMTQRELDKCNLSLNKVQYVNPLTIVTGRGLHSIGGRPIIKIKVQKYLNTNGYVFEDGPSYYIVDGRRKKKAPM
ncbi:uncharacterized protein SCODWIG_03509 [Saccharomycodes ludwigii]|uniref:Ubiquitin-binding protein CUE2 n=1 Tax=Saccharomycodes ludwigii TaxID=36035 RepID=A0A376BAN0_9ASCO|nr:hypothetical protein SCDLUD_004112 [Saccharomycodes ludwigii]KAH3899819.1 hypothetical protein SCDLUD_004112 [Saccharomycodes ludwigii]SSD61748.1 uncharacterized protein SCODWIG_03509 [Saccharomycodes ludwigii]